MNKYYKLKYDFISIERAICMKGEPVKIVKKIDNETYLCDVIFHKYKEKNRKITCDINTLQEISKYEFDELINNVNEYVYNLWKSQFSRSSFEYVKVIQYPHIYGVLTNKSTYPLENIGHIFQNETIEQIESKIGMNNSNLHN